jgi:hypothetical protein
MTAPICPNCNQPITRALDAPYGWWEWDDADDRFVLRTAAKPGVVDVAPWVHWDCMGELRTFHPQDFGAAPARAKVTRPAHA